MEALWVLLHYLPPRFSFPEATTVLSSINNSFAFFSIGLLHMFLCIPIFLSFPCFWKLYVNCIISHVFFYNFFFCLYYIASLSFRYLRLWVYSFSLMGSIPLYVPMLQPFYCGGMFMLLWTFLSMLPGTPVGFPGTFYNKEWDSWLLALCIFTFTS